MRLERIAARLIQVGLIVIVGFLFQQLVRKADEAHANRQAVEASAPPAAP